MLCIIYWGSLTASSWDAFPTRRRGWVREWVSEWEVLFHPNWTDGWRRRCSNRFSFAPLTHHLTAKRNTLSSFLFVSRFICLFVCSSLFNPPPLFFFPLSEFSLTKQTHSSQNRWVWNVPTLHTATDDSRPQWDRVCLCVCVLVSFVLSSAIYFSLSMPIHAKPSQSPQCLCFSCDRGHPVICL